MITHKKKKKERERERENYRPFSLTNTDKKFSIKHLQNEFNSTSKRSYTTMENGGGGDYDTFDIL
jgi:hypothetical protein